jgi:ferric-dicitrate binding protein FerR (iron transport regulator)
MPYAYAIAPLGHSKNQFLAITIIPMQKETPINKILSKLDDSISPDEAQQLETWRKASDENESFFKAFSFFWNDKQTGQTRFEPNTEQALSTIHHRISRRLFIRRTVKVAAIFVAFISIASLLLMLSPMEETNKIIAKHQQKITLPDGTTVILAQGSQLIYPEHFKSSKRKVELTGKAWFDVAYNPEQPFIVETHNARTKVLGTQFTITANDSKPTTVFLDKGKVAFRAKQWFSESHILKPGEMISFKNGAYQKSKQNNLNASSWATQQLQFKSTPLINVIRELEAYYKVKIELQTLQIGQLRFTGTLKEPTAKDALEIIALTLKLKLTQNENTLTLNL